MPGSAPDPIDLRRQAVLVAESNPLLALDLVATFSGWGADAWMVNDLDEGVELARSPLLAAALVDVALPLEGQEKLIEALRANEVPTALTTTTLRNSISDRFPGYIVFEKPVDFAALADWFNDL